MLSDRTDRVLTDSGSRNTRNLSRLPASQICSHGMRSRLWPLALLTICCRHLQIRWCTSGFDCTSARCPRAPELPDVQHTCRVHPSRSSRAAQRLRPGAHPAAVCAGSRALDRRAKLLRIGVAARRDGVLHSGFQDLPAFTGDGQRAVVLARLRTTIHDPAHASSSGTGLRNRVERVSGAPRKRCSPREGTVTEPVLAGVRPETPGPARAPAGTVAFKR